MGGASCGGAGWMEGRDPGTLSVRYYMTFREDVQKANGRMSQVFTEVWGRDVNYECVCV